MNIRERWLALSSIPAVRTTLFLLGILLMLASPAVGVLPGPGGVIVFAGGLALTLKYSEWAKHPNKGRWADWGLRRRSAKQREEMAKRRKERIGAGDD
jgi:hypothetical protein